jgi:hypothetical protein
MIKNRLKVLHGIKSVCWRYHKVWTIWRYHMVLNSLRVSHGIAKFQCITWYKTVWRYHMVYSSLNASHGIKQIESIWGKRVWSITVPFSFRNDNHSTSLFCNVMHSNCSIPCDTFKLIDSMWYIQTLLCHVIPSNSFIQCDILKYFQSVLFHVMHSNCCIPCDTFKLFYTKWCIETLLHAINQLEGITWYRTVWMHHIAK